MVSVGSIIALFGRDASCISLADVEFFHVFQFPAFEWAYVVTFEICLIGACVRTVPETTLRHTHTSTQPHLQDRCHLYPIVRHDIFRLPSEILPLSD